jgi:hypothetical protein
MGRKVLFHFDPKNAASYPVDEFSTGILERHDLEGEFLRVAIFIHVGVWLPRLRICLVSESYHLPEKEAAFLKL